MNTIQVPRLGADVTRRGFQVLCDHLGMAGALRFMLQYEMGAGDYTLERQKFLEKFSVEDLIERARQNRSSESRKHERKVPESFPARRPGAPAF